MIQRCENPNHSSFKNYGARGIAVCNRWRYGENGMGGYESWHADMGRKPSPQHTLDRYPDNDSNYEPANCRWATREEQNIRRRPRRQ